jgi:hypothetical protein
MLLGALVVCLLLLAVAGVVIVRLRRRGALRPPGRPRQILPGGGPVPEDLTQDAFTDDQRYLM